MVRTLDIVKDYSATLTGYVASAGRIHFQTWSGRFFRDPIDSFFPGFVVLLLAMAGAAIGIRRREWRARVAMLLAVGIAGVVLSLGTGTPVYGWLFAVFPPMRALRAAARLATCSSSRCGGPAASVTPRRSGTGGVDRRRAHPSRRTPSRWCADSNTALQRHPRQCTRLLAAELDRSSLVEQPFFPRAAIFENAPYVLVPPPTGGR